MRENRENEKTGWGEEIKIKMKIKTEERKEIKRERKRDGKARKWRVWVLNKITVAKYISTSRTQRCQGSWVTNYVPIGIIDTFDH